MSQPHSGSVGEVRSAARSVRDDRERYSTEGTGYDTGAEGDSGQPAWRSRSLLAETARLGLSDDDEPPWGAGVSPELESSPPSTANGPAPREPQVMSPTTARWYREPLAVADLMTRDVKTVSDETPITAVATLMRDEDVGAVPVVDAVGRVEGIVTDRDLVVRALARRTASPSDALGELCAAQVCTQNVDVVSPHDSISDVLHLLGDKQIRRAPVVGNDRRLIGMISLGDIAKHADHADHDHELQEALQHISARRSFWSRIWR